MSSRVSDRGVPADTRALVAVDLGAESCRVSLLRWRDERPVIKLVHRFGNGPEVRDDGLRWPLRNIEREVDEGLRHCATLAPEGVRSVGVDGWAVDYVRLDEQGRPLADPFCYRDERTTEAEKELHTRLSAERLRDVTGVQLLRINTVYQMVADRRSGVVTGTRWLNLPEYLLARWGGRPCAEFTNATHTQMVDVQTGRWSAEIFAAAGADLSCAPEIVMPGTALGRMSGELAGLPALADTELIAPACHDTSSAVAGIPAEGEDWGYISLGTWSLIGTLLRSPENGAAARAENFTNLGAADGSTCFHKNVNGMWLLKQCMDVWSATGERWHIHDLVTAAERIAAPHADELLDVDTPDLLLVGSMPARINAQRRARGLRPLDESAAGAPVLANLIVHSLAMRCAQVVARIETVTGKHLARLYAVGGASNNGMLLRLLAEATGVDVVRGPVESATHGNFAVQLAGLERTGDAVGPPETRQIAHWAGVLAGA